MRPSLDRPTNAAVLDLVHQAQTWLCYARDALVLWLLGSHCTKLGLLLCPHTMGLVRLGAGEAGRSQMGNKPELIFWRILLVISHQFD
jgi:hypothetical protein